MCRFKVETALGLIFATTAFGALGSFLWEQFGAVPCILCKTERTLLAIAAIFFFWAWFSFRQKGSFWCLRKSVKPAFSVGTLLWISTMGTFFYHMGIQLKWFALPKMCKASFAMTGSVEDMERILMNSTQGRCDQVEFMVLGLPPTFFFLLGACVMVFACFYTFHLMGREARGQTKDIS